MRLEYFWVKQISGIPMENKTHFSIGKVGKWKWIVPMDGNAFYSASRARRGEILFNGSHMLKTGAPGSFFWNNGPRCNRGKSSLARAGFPVLLKSLFPPLGIRTEINRVRAARGEGRGGSRITFERDVENGLALIYTELGSRTRGNGNRRKYYVRSERRDGQGGEG